MVNLSVSLAGVELKNPVIPASGTFGYGREYAEAYDLNILGSFSFKGTTGEARLGNPQPRIAETASGMLNAVGPPEPGIDAVIAQEIPNMARNLSRAPWLPTWAASPRRSTPTTAPSWTPVRTGGHSGGKHLLPQRPRRRQELRLRPPRRR